MYRFNRYWDNLKDGSRSSVKTDKNDLEFVLRPLPWHTPTELRSEMFVTDRESSDQTFVSNNTESMYWELRSEYRKLLWWTGVRLSDKADNITFANSRRSRGLDLGARYRWQWWMLFLSPNALLQLERDIEPRAQDKSKMVRLKLGSTVDGRDLSAGFHYGWRNENDQINTNNAERHMFDVDVRYFVFGNPARVITFTFRRDNMINANDTEWAENVMLWKYTEYF
jgi:hypothetical protein